MILFYIASFIFIGIGVYKKYDYNRMKKEYKEATVIVVG